MKNNKPNWISEEQAATMMGLTLTGQPAIVLLKYLKKNNGNLPLKLLKA